MGSTELTVVPSGRVPSPLNAHGERLDAFEIVAELSRIAAMARRHGWRVTLASDLSDGAEFLTFGANREVVRGAET